MIHCRFFMCILLRTTLIFVSIRRIPVLWRRSASAAGQSPPGEVQPPCPAQTEFVICDCTIEVFFKRMKQMLDLHTLRAKRPGQSAGLLGRVVAH
jgi:hypothetical protein